MKGYKLVLLPKEGDWDPAEGIPKYGLEYDFRYFDIPSLVRMYGKEEVERFLGGKLRLSGGER